MHALTGASSNMCTINLNNALIVVMLLPKGHKHSNVQCHYWVSV